MTQANLEFAGNEAATPVLTHTGSRPIEAASTFPATPSHSDAEAYSIGREHARHGLTPPLKHMHQDNPIRHGWAHAKPIFAGRSVKATPAHRQWLQLRIEAWTNTLPIDDIQLNPSYMAQIDSPVCPLTRQPITHFADLPCDATVVRLRKPAGYSAGNLVIISAQARNATMDCASWSDALHQAGCEQPEGAAKLSAAAWQRWAIMMSFAQRLPHAQAACLPLCVLPPNRVRVINPIQSVQVMLTLQFTKAGYARRLLTLAALLPAGETRQAFQIFMHTLLARRLSVGSSATVLDTRHALEDAWCDPLVNRRWQRLSLRLTEAMCEQWLQRACQRGCVVGGMQWVVGDTDVPGASTGRAVSASGLVAARPMPRRAYAAAASGLSKPGMARNLGSQKLAN